MFGNKGIDRILADIEAPHHNSHVLQFITQGHKPAVKLWLDESEHDDSLKNWEADMDEPRLPADFHCNDPDGLG